MASRARCATRRRRWRRALAALAIAVVLAPSHAGAQRADGREAVAYGDDDRWHRARCLLGLSYHVPTRLTASAAFGVRRMGARRTTCAFVAPQVGIGGAAIAPGIATTLGRFGSGVGVSGAALRTFGDPRTAAPWRTYAGVRLHVWPVLGLHGSVGWYRAVGDADALPRRVRSFVAWSVGFGF